MGNLNRPTAAQLSDQRYINPSDARVGLALIVRTPEGNLEARNDALRIMFHEEPIGKVHVMFIWERFTRDVRRV